MTNREAQRIRTARINNTTMELAKRECKNLFRWCEVTLKKTGEVVTVIRTGYGPAEYPERDSQKVEINGEVIAEFDSLYEVAEWMIDRA